MMILEAYGEWKGWHMWPEGAERGHPELAQPHWHNFQVRVRILTEADREVEFIAFGQDCADWLCKKLTVDHTLSCESMARLSLQRLEGKGVVVPLSVHVSEDGLSGAIVVSERRLADAFTVV